MATRHPASPQPTPCDRSRRQYLKPSVFWGIRQDFPRELSAALVVTSLAIPISIWSLLSYGSFVDSRFLPTPTATFARGLTMLADGNLMADVFASTARVTAGFILAAIASIPVGIAMGTFNSMDSLLGGFVRTARYLPIAAFVPLIIIWAGIDEASKVIIIFLGVFFYNATMIADAVKFIPNETLNVAYTLGASRWDVVRRVVFPATLPSILDALKVNVAGAWNFLVIAELVAAPNGLGFTIFKSQRQLQTDQAMFCILIICIIGLITDFAFRVLFKLWLPWADSKMS